MFQFGVLLVNSTQFPTQAVDHGIPTFQFLLSPLFATAIGASPSIAAFAVMRRATKVGTVAFAASVTGRATKVGAISFAIAFAAQVTRRGTISIKPLVAVATPFAGWRIFADVVAFTILGPSRSEGDEATQQQSK
tara:strand:+ start:1249 stop:1653 length:405 start_codon:yes stop_codon:yes gene_type:complete